jgi:homoserine O-acetyltransferase/O-succinyltransferase
MTESTRRAPLSADLLPASGAWRPGDPVGDRRFVGLPAGRLFALEGGGSLRDVTVAYETWGELDETASNALLVCHALTGDSHAAGPSGPAHPTEGWWDALIGPGRALDTDRWFVVCANVLGGCQGTTGPSSTNPATGGPYGSSFPVVSIRDIVRTQAVVADNLGIRRWLSVIGGSMGGMQALEWGVMYPDRVGSVVAIATTSAASPWQIGFSSVQRSAIALDPKWRGGDYYDAEPGDGPYMGLAVARANAQITYRSDSAFDRKFDRAELDPLDNGFTPWQRFQVEGYLDYHGAKLARRFDANSYLAINRAMDLHDLGRGRGGIERALSRVTAPVLTMAITSDTLYPPHQQQRIHDMIAARDARARHARIHSDDGHDAFLIATDQVGEYVAPFLSDTAKSETDRKARP